ncbi:protein FAR1-RELATED SEQUENCE 5-like [Lycium barbarum]|uniref:protein FAR1-RELATED SEQUENCE 5-like n=1 Tax=Lycium barbarum TaxID=112863 RepID=UPI00293E6AE7|nr:protein FAR1-RELATED SEQUENCE 5-like [Lycium barbarum]
MANFFWRDGRSRIDYEIFGDVVYFDTTYRTNKYRMICAPFIGINHHWQNIIFGCAFLSDESAESFKWLFSTFLKSMGGISPQTIITDQAQGMAIDIRKVMSGTRHRLCQWHISQNAPSHLGSLNNDKGFSKLFNKCMSECDSITEFEETWEMMLTIAGLKASSRSESTNHVLNGLGDLSTYLHIFVTNYEKNEVNKWRLSEEHEDFNCNKKEFLKGSGACYIEPQVYCDGQVSKYEVRMHNSTKNWFVELDSTTLHVTCTCKKFESVGILCAHCLLVFTSNKVREILAKYILKRWTKDVRKRIKDLPSKSSSSNGNSESSEIVYTNSVMKACYNLVYLSKSNTECREIFQRHLKNASDELDDYLGKLDNITVHSSAKKMFCLIIVKSQKVDAPPIKSLFENNVYTPRQATPSISEVSLQDTAFDLDLDDSNVSFFTLLQGVENTTQQSSASTWKSG